MGDKFLGANGIDGNPGGFPGASRHGDIGNNEYNSESHEALWGRSRGGAISIFGHRFKRQPKLFLNQVDILDSGNHLYRAARFYDDAVYAESADLENIFSSESTFGEPNLDLGEDNKKVIDEFQPFEPSPSTTESTFPYVQLVSSPRKANRLDARKVEVHGRKDTTDIFMLSYEQGSNVVGVFADLTDPSNPVNQIWNELYPGKEAEILAQYEAEYLAAKQSFDYKSILKSTLKMGCELIGKKAAGAKRAKLVCEAGFNAIADAYKASDKRAEAAIKRDAALDDNRKNQARLEDFLEPSAKIGEVNIESSRTPNIIRNFTFGKDVLLLPRSSEKEERIEVLTMAEGRPGFRQFGLKFENFSDDVTFVTVELSKESSRQFRPADSVADYVAVLLDSSTDGFDENGNKYTVLGAMLPAIVTVNESTYRSLPAAEYIQIDRGNREPGDRIEITTLGGNDIVEGTYGNERIYTGDGHDIVYPVFGKDTVNGSAGEHLVDYRLLKAALDFTGSTNAAQMSVIEVRKIDGGAAKCLDEDFEFDVDDTRLVNVEGINAFAGSQVDFRGLPDPAITSMGMGVYKATLGAGSVFHGSQYSDYVQIDFSDDYNCSSADAFSTITELNGGGFNGGVPDLLELDLSTFDGSYGSLRTEHLEDEAVYKIYIDDNLILEATGFEISEIDASDASEVTSFADSSIPHSHSARAGDDALIGGLKGDLLYGNSGSDVLKGGRGDDGLYGGRHADHLHGGRGQDLLIGGPGSDFLNGGGGSDVMRGGSGPDTFKLSKGRDVVRGFEVGTDIIQAFGIPELSQQGKNVLLAYAGGTTLLRKMALDDVAEWLTPQAGGLELLA